VQHLSDQQVLSEGWSREIEVNAQTPYPDISRITGSLNPYLSFTTSERLLRILIIPIRHSVIVPVPACRIMSASSEVTLSSPLTSAAASVAVSHEAEPPVAISSAIAASAGVI